MERVRKNGFSEEEKRERKQAVIEKNTCLRAKFRDDSLHNSTSVY